MQNISINNDEYFKELKRRRIDSRNLPIRKPKKKTRFFIDNEYVEKGYTKKLLPSTFAVYGVLARHANARTQTCFPSIPTIMREGGIGNRNTVVAAIKRLEDHNIIAVDHSKGRLSNLYTLLDAQHWKPINSANSDTIVSKEPSTSQNRSP